MHRPDDVDIWPRVQPHRWKWRHRLQPIRLILIHATRGGQPANTTDREFEAMISWETNPNNIIRPTDGSPPYGSMASKCNGGGGRLLHIMPDTVYPAYSAGHMDPIAKSYEMCQSLGWMKFDGRDVDRAVVEVAEDCIDNKIPPADLLFVSGDNREAPGIARHDRSANGRVYGKSDPGDNWPADFVARVDRMIRAMTAPATEVNDMMLAHCGDSPTGYRLYHMGDQPPKWIVDGARANILITLHGPPKPVPWAVLKALGAS